MKPQTQKKKFSRAAFSGNGRGAVQPGAETRANKVVHADTGLGTTYERWALNRFLLRLFNQYHFQSVLEAPGDGMTGISGINSLILGMQNVPVTLLMENQEKVQFTDKVWKFYAPSSEFHALAERWIDRLPFEDGEFEFVWNFNVMTLQEDHLALLEEMKRVSRRYIMVCIPNRRNYAFPLHKLHHRISGEPWDHGDIELMDPHPWQKLFNQINMQVEEINWLDCPWWPDIVDPAKMVIDFFPFVKRFADRARSENRCFWNYDELPYYCPVEHSDIHKRMSRLAVIEKSRFTWLKKKFAHHVCILASKES
jgi:hypothetical protein